MTGKLVFRQNLSSSNIVDHFSDQWKNHTKHQISRTFTDLVLVPDSGEIGVHMVVLMPLFPFLTNLVTESMAWWREQPVIILPEVKLATVQQMVNLLYSGTCDIVSDNLNEELVDLMASLGLIIPTDRLIIEYKDTVVEVPDNNISVVEKLCDQDCEKFGTALPNINENGHNMINSSITFINNEEEAVKKEDSRDFYDCLLCNKVFKYKRFLSLHMKSHTDERLYSCSSCNKTFKQRQHLIMHTKAKHEECSGIPATRRRIFKSHVSSEGSNKCQLCGYLSCSKAKLNSHMKMKHETVITSDKIYPIEKKGRPRKLLSQATATETTHSVSVKEGDKCHNASETEYIESYLKSKELGDDREDGSRLELLEGVIVAGSK